jgi:hypothetical protein
MNRIEVQSIIKNVSAQNNTILLKFSLDEIHTILKWEHSKEFEYNHQMYDIVKTYTFSDSIYYECMPDIKETNIKKISSDVRYGLLGTERKKNETKELTEHFFSTLFFQVISENVFFETITEYTFFSDFYYLPDFNASPPFPPPEFV